jgi:hypothetical protein
MSLESLYLSKEEIAKWLQEDYSNNACQFIVDFTKLFYNLDGSFNQPYYKQIMFMNGLLPEDRVVAVLKARQCIVGSTKVSTLFGELTVKEIYENNLKPAISCIDDKADDADVEDKIIDVWISEKQRVYSITLVDGGKLRCSAEHYVMTKIGWQEVQNLSPGVDSVYKPDSKKADAHGYVQVKGIFDTGIDEEMYEVETAVHENYYANGILSHNCGISTAIVGFAVHQAYFAKYPEVMIISATAEQAIKVMSRVKQCFYDMPEAIRPTLTQDTAQKIVLANGVKIIALSSNPKAAHGWTGLWLWDEVTKVTLREQEEIWEAIYPSTTKGGKVIMVATPTSTEGLFYDFCTKSLAEITGNDNVKTKIKKFFIHYKDVPHIVHAVENEGLFDPLTPSIIEREYCLQFRNDNEEEQFFPKDFVLTYLKEGKEIIPLFKSYTDLNIPHGYATLEALKETVPDEFIRHDLREKYDYIQAGYDPASTENDSVLSVAGRVIGTKNFHKIGQFLVNRVGVGFHDLDVQIRYIRNIIKVMTIDKMVMDKTGMGKGIYDNIKNNYYYIYNLLYGYDYNKEDKIGDFINFKTMIINGFYKQGWKDDKATAETLKQYTNIILNKMSNTLAAKGVLKDDIPNADMLSTRQMRTTRPRATTVEVGKAPAKLIANQLQPTVDANGLVEYNGVKKPVFNKIFKAPGKSNKFNF